MRELLIPFALVNNKVKHIDSIYKQDEAYCMECGSRLLLRNGDKNIKHLAHSTDSNCKYKNEIEYKKRGGGESYYHKYSKEFIRDNLDFFRLYGNQIIIKDGEFKIGGYKDLKVDGIDIEYRGLKSELGLEKNYIPDILIRTGEVLIALEIYNSNKKIVSDIEENLKGKNIYVYEVDISNIEELNFKDIFRNMKLIFSNLKLEFNAAMKPIQNKIIECNKLNDILCDKNDCIDELNNEIYELRNSIYEANVELNELKQIGRVRYLEDKIKRLQVKDNENKKCWSKCVKDWYSNKLNMKINNDIKRCSDYEEGRMILESFKRFYNGKVGAYSSCGGDDKLKEIADITKSYDSAIKYLGMDNDRFKRLVGMVDGLTLFDFKEEKNASIDMGEKILRSIIDENILEIK